MIFWVLLMGVNLVHPNSCPPLLTIPPQAQPLFCPLDKERSVYSRLNATLTEGVLGTVYGLNTSKLLLTSLSTRFVSQSPS
ncbi:hypothetical protein I3760_01G046000 [Carya illinoinensis]|nr:hypothetical protein I3760_01G046000 [Carya illinoinensis]